ncbi:hypothetical protein MTO98_30740 [Mucilaginibacter sp. SMC90]|uniref:hypothetical protein n=1 Tax=Mucilaginibacter sp. SMC90 TaxID=2929803 RepID=UPI001FB35A69|nr:hypothetical protein [Mucilaginibacter sp. SMC90]UOE48780.1 hypothetical protein MTO98_30740 [Mucilaginibacter sp. SMC90]
MKRLISNRSIPVSRTGWVCAGRLFAVSEMKISLIACGRMRSRKKDEVIDHLQNVIGVNHFQ